MTGWWLRPDHAVVLGVTMVGIGVLIGARRRLRPRRDQSFRRVAAIALLANEAAALMIALAEGHPRVPLQLCDVALGLLVWALWTLRPAVCELAYFWGMAGSLQAIATPDLTVGFPDYWWVKFFIGHCGVVLAAVYLAASGRVQPTLHSVWRAWGWANGYAVVAGLVNAVSGANYGYLARKPQQPSLLDVAGPWPWYILTMEAVAFGSFLLLATPWWGRAHRTV